MLHVLCRYHIGVVLDMMVDDDAEDHSYCYHRFVRWSHRVIAIDSIPSHPHCIDFEGHSYALKLWRMMMMMMSISDVSLATHESNDSVIIHVRLDYDDDHINDSKLKERELLELSYLV